MISCTTSLSRAIWRSLRLALRAQRRRVAPRAHPLPPLTQWVRGFFTCPQKFHGKGPECGFVCVFSTDTEKVWNLVFGFRPVWKVSATLSVDFDWHGKSECSRHEVPDRSERFAAQIAEMNAPERVPTQLRSSEAGGQNPAASQRPLSGVFVLQTSIEECAWHVCWWKFTDVSFAASVSVKDGNLFQCLCASINDNSTANTVRLEGSTSCVPGTISATAPNML